MFGAWEKKSARGETPHTRKTRKLYTERPGIEPANPSTIRQLSNQLTNSEYFLDNKSFRQGLSITYSPILSQIFNYMSTKLFKVPNILRSDLLNTHSALRSLRSSFLRRLSFLISYLWTKGDRDSCSGISRQLRLFTHWYCCSVWPKYFWLKKTKQNKNLRQPNTLHPQNLSVHVWRNIPHTGVSPTVSQTSLRHLPGGSLVFVHSPSSSRLRRDTLENKKTTSAGCSYSSPHPLAGFESTPLGFCDKSRERKWMCPASGWRNNKLLWERQASTRINSEAFKVLQRRTCYVSKDSLHSHCCCCCCFSWRCCK